LCGGGPVCRRVLCNYGSWRCRLIRECEFAEADERHPTRYRTAPGVRRHARPNGLLTAHSS